jgi:hypothetical protein
LSYTISNVAALAVMSYVLAEMPSRLSELD